MILNNQTEDEIREKIVKDIDRNCFVEAGAGAGKTTIIVDRIVEQLKHGILPERLVAITFTNAASRELRARILNAVRTAVKDASLKDKEKENLELAEKQLDRMQISTIHSFCHRLLTERCFDAGLPMGFDLMESEDENALFDSIFAKWTRAKLTSADWAVLMLMDEKKAYEKAYKCLREMTRDLAGLSKDMDILTANVDQSEIDTKMKELCEKLVTALDDHAGNIIMDNEGEKVDSKDRNFMNLPEPLLSEAAKKLREILKKGIGSLGNEDYAGILNAIDAICNDAGSAKPKAIAVYPKMPPVENYFKKLKKAKKSGKASKEVKEEDSEKEEKEKDPKEERDEYLNTITEAEKEFKTTVGAETETIRNELTDLFYNEYILRAKEAREYYRECFPSDIVSDDMLLLKTYELLKDSPDILRYFAGKFDCYYVDEFQDTDHIQENFIWKLAQDPDDRENLRDGALFVVGDPKQSIYRFRGAEPEVYFGTKKKMEKLQKDNTYICSLTKNFRSDDSIINWVNSEFSGKDIISEGSYTPMTVGHQWTNPQGVLKGVYMYASPEVVQGKIDHEEEAERVCRLIKAMVGKKEIEIYESETKSYRRKTIDYSDILLLTGNMFSMEVYVNKMREEGIPFILQGKSVQKYSYYINAFICLYSYLADPYDRTAREGALGVLEVSGASDTERNRSILEEMKKRTKGYSGYACMEFLLHHKELYLPKGKDIPDHEMEDLQRKLIQMTEKISANEHENKTRILERLREYRESVLERELAMEDTPAVQFMNLHKAKGLEGNIVIFAKRDDSFGFKPGSYRKGTDYYPCAKEESWAPDGSTMKAVWSAYERDDDILAAARKEAEREKVRLEYVAATRAKQVLIFMDRYNGDDGNLFGTGYDLDQRPSIGNVVDLAKDAQDTAADSKPQPSRLIPAGLASEDAERKMHENLKKALYSSESPSDYERESAGKAEADAGDQNMKERPKGRILGLAMHRSFELLLERRFFDDPDIDRLIRICVKQALFEGASQIDSSDRNTYERFLTQALQAFAGSGKIRDLLNRTDKIYTELPFSYNTESEEIPVWMHGEADLVLKMKDETKDGGYYILDYKSDDDSKYPDEESFEKRLRGKYEPQIAAYRAAVSKVFDADEKTICAALISFSYKDTAKGEDLRLRITEI